MRNLFQVLRWSLGVSAGIHAALVPEHLQEMPRVGVSFILCAAAMSVVFFFPNILAALATLGGSIVAWLLAITTGIPFLMDGPEPIEQIAVVTKVVEGAGIAAALLIVLHRFVEETASRKAAEALAGAGAVAGAELERPARPRSASRRRADVVAA